MSLTPPPSPSPRRAVAARLAAPADRRGSSSRCWSSPAARRASPTTTPGLNVRAAPTTASRVVGRLPSSGTNVNIDCYTRGQSIHGQTLWYRISNPHKGYVTAYYVRADSSTRAHTPSC